MYLHWIELS